MSLSKHRPTELRAKVVLKYSLEAAARCVSRRAKSNPLELRVERERLIGLLHIHPNLSTFCRTNRSVHSVSKGLSSYLRRKTRSHYYFLPFYRVINAMGIFVSQFAPNKDH